MLRSLNVSVAVVRPGVSSVTHSMPVAALEYIELIASGRTDATGLFSFKSDIVLVLDQKSITTGKRLADTQSMGDATFKTPGKKLADSAAPADARPVFDTSKALKDLAPMLDARALVIANILADAFSTSDQPYKVASKPLADAFGFTDAQTVQAQKLIQDSVSFVEAVSAVRAFMRVFSETATPTDFVGKAVVKAPFTESVAATDARDVLPLKRIFDGVAMDDGTSVGDGSTYSIQKLVNNIAFATDASARQNTKPLKDTFGVSEAGLVSAQNFSDITYFAEDFVGASSSF